MEMKDRLTLLLNVSKQALQVDTIVAIIGEENTVDINAAIVELAMQGSITVGPDGVSLVGVPTGVSSENTPIAERDDGQASDAERIVDGPIYEQPEPETDIEGDGEGRPLGLEAGRQIDGGLCEVDLGEPDEQALEPDVQQHPRLNKTDGIEKIGVSNYITNKLLEAGVVTVGDYVAAALQPNNEVLTPTTQSRAAEMFEEHLTDAPYTLSRDQYRTLIWLSGSKSCIYDMFGFAVRPTIPQSDDTSDPSQVAENADGNITLEEILGVGYLSARLENEGIITLNDFVSKTEDELLGIQGFGIGKLQKVQNAVRDFVVASGEGDGLASQVLSPMDIVDFERLYGPSVIDTVREAYEFVDPNGTLVEPDTFLVIMAPYAKEIIEAGADEPVQAAVSAFWNLPDIIRTSGEGIASHLEMAAAGSEFDVTIPPGAEWTEAAEIAAEISGLAFREENRVFEDPVVPLEKWIEALDERSASILRMHFDGQTLEEVGNSFGVTRERIRQIEKRALEKRPRIAEEKYRYLVETYKMDRETFAKITGEKPSAYGYLRSTSDAPVPTTSVKEAVGDELLAPEIREAVSEIVVEDCVILDGRQVLASRYGITYAILEREGATVSKRWLMDEYSKALEETSFDDKTFDERNYESWLTRQKGILFAPVPYSFDPEGKCIRCYPTEDKDFTVLKDYLESGLFANQEESTLTIFDEPSFAPIGEQLDIRNGYELHTIIRTYCPDAEGVLLGRMPTIEFGDAPMKEGASSSEEAEDITEDIESVTEALGTEEPDEMPTPSPYVDQPEPAIDEPEIDVFEREQDPVLEPTPERETVAEPEPATERASTTVPLNAQELEAAKVDLENWLGDMLAGEFDNGQLPPAWIRMLNEAEECVVDDVPYPDDLLERWLRRTGSFSG